MTDNNLELSIRVKDESSDIIKQISVSAEDLAKGMRAVKEETERLNSEIVNIEQLGQIFDSVQRSVNQLVGACRNLTDVYQQQTVVENQLQTVMQQRMAATQEDVNSIKALCTAQQQLGVISDEVQLSGAQQLAMYISQKDSLEALIPAMNNLLAQQNGLNASAGDAAGIATLLGAAMQGQTGALQKAGISFSTAQQKILQFGTESQRAATLAEAIRSSVGDMNAELAKTDAGQQKQLENTFGTLKEELGGMIQPLMTTLTVVSQLTTSVTGILELTQSFSVLAASTRIASAANAAFSTVTAAAGRLIYIYQMQVLTARAAISATTGATRALNIAIAASPYLIAAAAAAALAVGIYKIATSSNETEKAQKRLNDIMVEMNTQVAKETIALNDLFAPLNRAKEGSEEWQKAKDAILAKYGSYLEKIGVEIKDVDSARIAYSRLSQAILDTARARAMEKATSGAAETYAGTEGEALKNIREQLYSGIGEGAGKITARQADEVWAQIRAAVRSGKDIPQEAREILEQTNTIYHDQFGTHTMSPIAEYIYRQVREVRQANDNYKKEIADAQAIFGGTGGVLPADAEAPIETQLTFTENNAQLEDTIAGIKTRLERAKFEAKYTLKPIEEETDKPGASPIKDAMKSSLDKGGALDGFRIPEMDMEKPLSDMERWNNALDAGREKNAATIESLGAMGGAMGTLGNTVGGAAGQWLDWAGNCMQAIAQALPQLAALATANTATAATGAASSMAGIPFVGPVLAIAAVASILGALANLPKFANGGLAYGPTLGLFGEYAGAGNNPEVVAPLNKLRSLIQPAYGTGTGGTVEFKIAGRYLKGILNREGNLDNRS